METKYFIYSKRFWLNAIAIAISIIGIITKTYPVSPEIIAVTVGILNLVLAQLSDKPLGFTRK